MGYSRSNLWRDMHFVAMCKRYPYMKQGVEVYDSLGDRRRARPEEYKGRDGWSRASVLRVERILRSEVYEDELERAEKAALMDPEPANAEEAEARLRDFIQQEIRADS